MWLLATVLNSTDLDVCVRIGYLVQKILVLCALILDIVKLISKLVLLTYMHTNDLFFIVSPLQHLDCQNFKSRAASGTKKIAIDYFILNFPDY